MSLPHLIISLLAEKPMSYHDLAKRIWQDGLITDYQVFDSMLRSGFIQRVSKPPPNFFDFSDPPKSSELFVIIGEPARYQLAMPIDKIEKLLLL